jgi:hypothetical protein
VGVEEAVTVVSVVVAPVAAVTASVLVRARVGTGEFTLLFLLV